MNAPDQADVDEQVAAFERELAGAKTAREAQTVRDRFLGRKHSVVQSWMQLISGAAPEEKKAIGRHANALKQRIEVLWSAFTASGVLA
jgi:hypothetical protein